jgi:integrase
LCSGVFRLAQAKGLRNDNPAEPVREILPKKKRTTHMPAVVDLHGLGDILRRVDAASLSGPVHMAHRLTAFSVARISNIVEAEWPEFHLDAEVPVWIIPRAKMKAKDREHDHKIVLGPVIANELRAWRKEIGSRGFLFPGRTGGKHISRESLEKAYRVTVGLTDKHSPHSWRAAFSTLARENDFERDVVELTLDHIHDNEVARAYDRGERLKERIRLSNWWADELAKAQRGGEVVRIKKATA